MHGMAYCMRLAAHRPQVHCRVIHITIHLIFVLLQSRCDAATPADTSILSPTPAAGLEVMSCYGNVLLLCTTAPHQNSSMQVLPPVAYAHQPATNFNTRFVHVSLNKVGACRRAMNTSVLNSAAA